MWSMIVGMSIRITVVDSQGSQIRSIPEPNGTIFDAAGGFDRLLEEGPSTSIWSSIDPNGTVLIDRSGAKELLKELSLIIELAKTGIETQGLTRLRLLAGMCAGSEALFLKVEGN
jgi:hypothetical protein